MRPRSPLLVALLAVLVLPSMAEAQIKRLRRAAENAIVGETARQIDRLLREAVRCALGDTACQQQAKRDRKEVIYVDGDGEVITDDDGVPITDAGEAARRAGGAPSQTPKPGEGAWANYDFVPGDEILFYEDFQHDNVGDFPRRLTFVRGNWDVVEWQGRRLLRNTGPRHSALTIPLPRELPERFTIEIEAYLPHINYFAVLATSPPTGANYTTFDSNYFQVGVAPGTGVAARRNGVSSLNRTDELSEDLVPVRIMVDGQYAKVYVNERRVANVPNAQFLRSDHLYLENAYAASAERPFLVGSIRVAAGGLDLYDVLARDGRVATQGILFDVNSDVIRPESTPTLKEIGTMLQEHADLRISIEGHTDSDGEDAFNRELSERRAASVRAFLIETYGIDEARLQAAGFGESKPIAPNDTAEGRQQNRRVELVRIQ